ncbi:hypothetical protein LTR56_023955 [Elasticomyces elasticus]|nr:hypothetical protein LTR56_023955 [Elasticomyces elasticus]KAK3634655.1 hypothetical protein LTR22_019548 [Elasticomyces elasticus]KAK4911343.1 hypothetical protein LTR49_020080 [Elasticomyces elasticus]KAK5758193.1 hypothetical protein LTS12_011663 [Elasticomyces elasticus]
MKVEVERIDLTGDAHGTSSYRGTKDAQDDIDYQNLCEKVTSRLHPTAAGKLGQEWHASLSDNDRAVQVMHMISTMQLLKNDLDLCVAASLGTENNIMRAAHSVGEYYKQMQTRTDSIMSRTKERRPSHTDKTKPTQNMSHPAGATQQTVPDDFVDIDTINDDSDTDAIFVSQSSSKRAARPTEHFAESTFSERPPARPFAAPGRSMNKLSHDSPASRDNHYRNTRQGTSPSPSSKPRHQNHPRPQFQTPRRRDDAPHYVDSDSPPTPSSGRKRARNDDGAEGIDMERTPPKRKLIGEADSTPSHRTRRPAQGITLSPDATHHRSRTNGLATFPSASPESVPTLEDYQKLCRENKRLHNECQLLRDETQEALNLIRAVVTENRTDRRRIERLESVVEAEKLDKQQWSKHFTSETNKRLNALHDKYQEMIDSNDQAPVVAEMRVPGGPYGGPRETHMNEPPGVLAGAVGVAPRPTQPGADDY